MRPVTERRQERLVAVTTPCDGASRPAQRRGAVAWRSEVPARVSLAHMGRRTATRQCSRPGTRSSIALEEPLKEQSLAGVVVGEAG